MTRDSDERGQATVIGIVILTGLVAIGGIGILLVGGTITGESQDRAEDERIEKAFVELDGTLDSVGQSPDGIETVDLDLPSDSDAAIRREDAGKIVVRRTNLTDTSTVVVKDIGEIVYEHDQTTYAYQAGAVFRGSGNQTIVVSAPGIQYQTNNGTEPTLTLPITDLEGSEQISGGDVEIRKNETVAPLNDVSTIDNQLVEVVVSSDYYVGWGRYFENRYDDAVVQYNHSANNATILLGKRGIDGDFDQAVRVGGDVNLGTAANGIDGDATLGGSFSGPGAGGPGPVPGVESCGGENTCNEPMTLAPLDPVIESKIQTAESNYPDVSSTTENGGTLTAGSYYTEGFHLEGETLEFDLTNGNVTLVVNGSIGMSGSSKIKVVNADQNDTCCYARLYVGNNGPNDGYADFAKANDGEVVTYEGSDAGSPENNASRFQMYGTSEMHFAVGQPGSFTGVVYAPRDGDEANGDNAAVQTGDEYFPGGGVPSAAAASCSSLGDPEVCIGTGGGDVDGALIGFHSMGMQAGGGVDYDESLENIEPTLGYDGVIPPPITYVHVSVNKVDIEED